MTHWRQRRAGVHWGRLGFWVAVAMLGFAMAEVLAAWLGR